MWHLTCSPYIYSSAFIYLRYICKEQIGAKIHFSSRVGVCIINWKYDWIWSGIWTGTAEKQNPPSLVLGAGFELWDSALSRRPGTVVASLCHRDVGRIKCKGDDGKGKERKRNDLFLDISEISFDSFGWNSCYVRFSVLACIVIGFYCKRCVASIKKRYWDYKLPCIRTQVELSSTFVYNYEMSSGGGSARNSHLPQGGANDHDVHAYETICTSKRKIQ